mmetsp:Transcript_34262/g.61163  ORF Transcript_34262/g.61163 Transcript_34262/m.61163 type:complete len:202 (+) Transcript_34262:342-947(+)
MSTPTISGRGAPPPTRPAAAISSSEAPYSEPPPRFRNIPFSSITFCGCICCLSVSRSSSTSDTMRRHSSASSRAARKSRSNARILSADSRSPRIAPASSSLTRCRSSAACRASPARLFDSAASCSSSVDAMADTAPTFVSSRPTSATASAGHRARSAPAAAIRARTSSSTRRSTSRHRFSAVCPAGDPCACQSVQGVFSIV